MATMVHILNNKQAGTKFCLLAIGEVFVSELFVATMMKTVEFSDIDGERTDGKPRNCVALTGPAAGMFAYMGAEDLVRPVNNAQLTGEY